MNNLCSLIPDVYILILMVPAYIVVSKIFSKFMAGNQHNVLTRFPYHGEK